MTAYRAAEAQTETEATLVLAHRFLDAVNTKNADALLETMSEDSYYHLHAAPDIDARGHEGIRQAGMSFKGVDICPVADGKITAKISYVDATAWYEQLTFEGE